jgi:hypothetical protein
MFMKLPGKLRRSIPAGPVSPVPNSAIEPGSDVPPKKPCAVPRLLSAFHEWLDTQYIRDFSLLEGLTLRHGHQCLRTGRQRSYSLEPLLHGWINVAVGPMISNPISKRKTACPAGS